MAAKRVRQYAAHGSAGCVQRRRCQQTGLSVGIYYNEQALFDVDAGPWSTVCEEHGCVVGHPTLQLARDHAPDPEGWCEDCRERAEQRLEAALSFHEPQARPVPNDNNKQEVGT
jgi:hypothetical protein